MTEPISYKDTLNLPKTNFDMKANLTQREPAMLAAWQNENLYQKIRARSHPQGKWVLHDGPPYANGDIHMGHLINKVLKDIVIKFRTMQGHDAPYVPGWDCHGLPIESAIQKELGPKFRELSKDQVRQKCHDYAMKYVQLQSASFARLGIFFGPGEQDRYLTLNPQYEGGVLDVLAELVQRDLVYRKKKPVHWCTFDRTALAEAELEYQTKKDNSIYVGFELSRNERSLHALPPEWNQLIADTGSTRPHRLNLLIWTTTPWTLPANRAVAINPEHEYVLVAYTGEGNRHLAGGMTNEYLVVAKELVAKVMRAKHPDMRLETSWLQEPDDRAYFVSSPVRGADWVKLNPTYIHPLDPARLQPVVLADYVTLEDGTGLVHTAPGHGKEDYQTGIKYNLDIYNPVLADGKYDDTVPDFLKGKSIWDANQLVIDKLKETGALFHHQQFDHEYPHCWRCKKPVIFRATEQWFVAVDQPFPLAGDPVGIGPKSIRDRAAATTDTPPSGLERDAVFQNIPEQNRAQVLSELAAAQRGEHESIGNNPALETNLGLGTPDNSFHTARQVKFIPEWGNARLRGMLDTRPDWCISRQRSWGVPIPAFFDAKGRCLLTEASVRRVATYFRAKGADAWYTDTPAQILGLDPSNQAQGLQSLGFPADLDFATLDKGADILDVWFESGASHHAVLECTHPELGYPANLYLEGSDQHRGWFQSSLLEASGYKPEPPFKQVLTHGFVVDEKGRKMSKSEGNDIKVDAALKQYGADVLRLWVASVDYQNDIPCGPNLLTKTGEAYRKIRNTIRYLLGNLYDFNPTTDTVEPAAHSIDRWMQNRVNIWAKDIHDAYDRYEFHAVFKNLYEFCNVEISAIYAKAIKDRLYCELPGSPKRRASQTVCYRALVHLVELSAPVLAFTAEESWTAIRALPGCGNLDPSVHVHQFQAARSNFDQMRETVTSAEKAFRKVTAPDATSQDAETLKAIMLQAGELARTLRSNLTASEASDPWLTLMPLIESANKQLDELKKSLGGKFNTLDAEVVIILPKVQDDISRHIADYGPEIEDALGVGFHRIEHGETWDIKIVDTREKSPSCARSWKRRPDVGSDPAYPDLSARDAAVVTALRAGK